MRGYVEKRGKTFTVRYFVTDPLTGVKKYYRKGGFAKKREAEEFLRKLLEKPSQVSAHDVSGETLASYLRSWFEAHKSNLSFTTVRRYEGILVPI